MKVIFISAPYSSVSATQREDITRAVEATALLLWENGIATLAPHLNSGGFSNHRPVDPSSYRKGYVELARRCDAILTLFVSTKATGVQAEVAAVRDTGGPVFKDVKAVLKWAKDR